MVAPRPCADCQLSDALFEIRKRWLCRDCFLQYVNIKALKRMDPYRLKNLDAEDRPNLAVCLSGGLSSLVSLFILDQNLQRQKQKSNRTAYDLTLIHITQPEVANEEQEARWRQSVATRFPAHRLLEPVYLHQVFATDPNAEGDLQQLGIMRASNVDDDAFLRQVMIQARTASARADLLEILLQRLIVATARKRNCHGIVWGHSDSRLAAKTLADVAKGRGGSVSNHIVEKISIQGMMFHHPLRDLFTSELELYLQSVADDISDCLLPAAESIDTPPSIRLTSIDNLLINYIKSQGEKYPGIMANVVRTAARLQVPANTDRQCAMCSTQIRTELVSQFLCYGCEQLKHDIVKE